MNDGKTYAPPLTGPPNATVVQKSTYTPLLERSDSTASTAQVNQRVLVSAVANFSTAYNLAIIGSVVPLVTETNPTLDMSCIPAITSCSLVGAIVGQLIFGYIGDVLGRKKGMILTLFLTVIGAVASAILPWNSSIYSTLAICRFILGIGVGGVYPLSAAAAAEGGSDPVVNNKRVAAVFSFQGWGQLASFLMCYILLETSLSHEWTWRVLLGLGALPGVFVLHEAITSEETKAFLKSQHNPNRLRFSAAMRLYYKQFLGTSLGWFLFDITFYGNILFTPIILDGLYDGVATSMVDIAQFSVFTSLIALPGYYLSYFMMGTMDFKHIQMQGFFAMAILFLVMGLFYTTLLPLKTLLFCMYGLTFFFSNFGPNVTTFSLPAELFPSDVRVQFNGMSAAAGKLGAAVGAYWYGYIQATSGVSMVLVVSGLVSVLGLAVTQFLIPSKHYR
ncbi:hypothetical protein, variant 1 [Aphanomyces invadans]|uniref:Major facilitator superfamily (MFS) profile domain-containing protein n=1 Tax=Aphanomyces invadans TaxID=157072 RepID=A0A024THR1_9STRA|nr:hypothetical protein, variant 1 [Aphanomyces invadans]ETV93700.1 hypothetical protein, variant 1 [Aphanomyces invadans]|eukprot:XP_008877740.1 hypothetical protein, variant 1 [Aphanomyces invadans]